MAGFDGAELGFRFAGGCKQWLGFFGKSGGSEGFGGAVFFCGEAAECRDAGELLRSERRAQRFTSSGNERAGSATLDGDHTSGGEIFEGIPSGGVEDLEGWL